MGDCRRGILGGGFFVAKILLYTETYQREGQIHFVPIYTPSLH